jgi:hypothetical protein
MTSENGKNSTTGQSPQKPSSMKEKLATISISQDEWLEAEEAVKRRKQQRQDPSVE